VVWYITNVLVFLGLLRAKAKQVNECPEKDRDTTQGRATGPTKELLVWAGSVLGPSLSDRKILSDDASWLIIACRNARDGRVWVSGRVVCNDVDVANSDLDVASSNLCRDNLLEGQYLGRRKPGGSSSRPERGGGWGAIGYDRELEGGSEGKGRSPGPATGIRVRWRLLLSFRPVWVPVRRWWP